MCIQVPWRNDALTMKIGIDARFWQETGVGRYIRNLSSQLQIIDTNNEYVLFVRKKDFEEVTKKMGHAKWKIVLADVPWHSLREQLELPKVLERENLDLMHFPYFSMPIFYQGAYIITIHDLIIHHFATGEATTLPKLLYYLKREAYKYIIQQAAKNASHIIAVSQATKKEIIDHLHVPENKISVTYEGVDLSISSSSVGFQISNFQFGKYFLHVGNVYPHKNAKRLVEAFAQANMKDTKLLFVGKKDYFMTQLEEFVRAKHLRETVIFLGYVDDATLASLLQNALAVIVPSLMEGFGLPVLEAMSQGCLVLASDIPSLREIAGDCAFYFSPFVINDISAKMRRIAESKKDEFQSRKKKGREIAKQFTWKTMAEQTLAIYESCVSLRSS